MTPDTTLILTATSVSFLTATLLVPRAPRAACEYGLTDRPGRGKIHQQAMPYLGGVAIVLAVAASISLLPAWTTMGAAILVGGVIVGFVGLIDDVRNLGPGVRLAAEAAAGSVAVAGRVGGALLGGPLGQVLNPGGLGFGADAFYPLPNIERAAGGGAGGPGVVFSAAGAG